MPDFDASRRGFLKLSGSAATGSWLAAQWPALLAIGQTACVARDKQAALVHLETKLAADLAAIAAQIIPRDDTPGAAEAGVIYFIDGALGSFMKGALGFIDSGISELNTRVAQQFPVERFAELSSDQQIAVLKIEDQTPLFGTVRFLTIAGMFAMPAHGGNQEQIGWDLLGFDNRHGWQPPFGFYDTGHHNDE